MKKTIFLAFICLAATSFLSCGSKGNIRTQDSNFIKEGWIDEDTYRVTIIAAPESSLAETELKKKSAKEKALKLARRKVMQKFVDMRVRRAKSPTEIAATGVAVSKKFRETVRNGEVIKESYDNNNNCTVTYQVQKNGLKNEVIKIK
jgi:hypothetical protein